MSDIMRQIPFDRLMDWVLSEYQDTGAIFGVKKFFRPKDTEALGLFREKLETPFGPAAGPHTQLAQNIIASYVAGSRFFELKTVQILDGEELPVSKPCILARDECYNVEWSTELYVPQAFDEYVKGWFALKLLSRELGLGNPDGFMFNMSVGYDLKGIKTKKIDDFIEGMKNAESTGPWKACKHWALSNLSRFKNVDREYINSISPRVCDSITLSTLHGCPPDEIERIATYLITEKKLNTFIKCNPTLLGYEYARKTLNNLGFDYIVFDDRHFKADLQFSDAVPMLRRLIKLSGESGLAFGVKLTNTFPVTVAAGELPGNEMYMSGRSLFPLSIALANRLSKEFDGKLRISYSGGADAHNIEKIYDAGIWPITLATTLLKPGGYQRLRQMAEKLKSREYKPFTGVNLANLQAIVDGIASDPLYHKPVKPAPPRKMKKNVPLIDCFEAPCRDGCPINQDIPAYLRLAGEGRHLDALRVITERNPLPFVTGTICSHRCMEKCTRDFYEEPVHIRKVKFEAAEKAYARLMDEIKAPAKSGAKVAVIGGGPAGLSAAYFLAKSGFPVTVFEKRNSPGGIVRHVIPSFRIDDNAIDNDVALVEALGVEIRLNSDISSLDDLRAKGFERIIIATGAWKPGVLELKGGCALGVLEFLERFKSQPDSVKPGENVVIIGGGNTAIDAARAAKRVNGVKTVSLVYRRTKRYMPADEEELALAVKDGVEFRELCAPIELKGGSLICERMELGAPDASGRRSPQPTGETLEIPADTVISAIGDLVDKERLQGFGLEIDGKGRPAADKDTRETNIPGVYVIGDAARGPSTVAESIADAIACAKAVSGIKTDCCAALNVNPDARPAEDKKGVLCCDTGSVHESERCLECATLCECCADVCPNRANVVVPVNGKPQIVHVDYMCNECGNCEEFCPYSSAPYHDKLTLFACESDFENSRNQGFLPLEDGRVRVRLGVKTADYKDAPDISVDVWNLIQATLKTERLVMKKIE